MQWLAAAGFFVEAAAQDQTSQRNSRADALRAEAVAITAGHSGY